MGLYEDDSVEETNISTPKEFLDWLEDQDFDKVNDTLIINLLVSDNCEWKSVKQLKELVVVYTTSLISMGVLIDEQQEEKIKEVIEKVQIKKKASSLVKDFKQSSDGYYMEVNVNGVIVRKNLTDFYVDNVRVTSQNNNVILIVDIHSKKGIYKNIELSGVNLTDIRSMRSHIKTRARATIRQDMSPVEFQAMVDHIESLPSKNVKTDNYLGCHYENGVPYVAYMGADPMNGHKDIKYLIGEDDNNNPHLHLPSMDIEPNHSFPPFDEDKWKEMGNKLFGSVPFLNDPIKMYIIMAWFFVSPIKDIQDTFSGKIKHRFPILNIVGTPGSGKTTIVGTLAKMMGWAKAEGGASFGRPFSIMKSLSESNALVHWIDEYKVDSKQSKDASVELAGLLRRTYDSGFEERGTSDQKKITYYLKTPTVVSGESAFSDQALLERSIQLIFSKEETEQLYKNTKSYDVIMDLTTEELNAYGTGHIRWLLTHHEEWVSWVQKCEKEVQAINTSISERMKRSITWILAGIDIHNRIAEINGSAAISQGVRQKIIDFILGNGQAVQKESSLDATLIEFLADNWHMGLNSDQYYPHPTTRKHLVDAESGKFAQLIFQKVAWRDRFSRYCSKTDKGSQTEDIINRTIRDLEKKGCLVRVDENARFGGKAMKSFWLDTGKAQELFNINPEAWEYDPDSIE